MSINISIAVRDLVDFVFRRGVIERSNETSPTFKEGQEGHRYLQKLRQGEDYEPEVPISYHTHRGEFQIELRGRADGVFTGDDVPVIEEIKTTHTPLLFLSEKESIHHMAQTMLYAAILAGQEGEPKIIAQLSYLHLPSKAVRSFRRVMSSKDAATFLDSAIDIYVHWLQKTYAWRLERNDHSETADFPFASYRPGQDILTQQTEKVLSSCGTLFAEAPTGIGKTSAVLYGALKAARHNVDGPIYYLTARGTGAKTCADSFELLDQSGFKVKRLFLTARSKICAQQSPSCLTGDCPLAKNHKLRFESAADALWEKHHLDRTTIEDVAKEYQVCPYALGVSLAPFVDVVVGDFNYVFDPRANGINKTPFGFGRRFYLADEAHNIVDRARDIFSVQIDSQMLKAALKECKSMPVIKSLEAIDRYLNQQCKPLGKDQLVELDGPPEKLSEHLENFLETLEKAEDQKRGATPQLDELFFESLYYQGVTEIFNKNFYRAYVQKSGSIKRIKLFCIDPSRELSQELGGNAGIVFFSGTLTPMHYFRQLLTTDDQSRTLKLMSPYPPENVSVIVRTDMSTRYKDRADTANRVADVVRDICSRDPGNYLVFFPSYRYMEMVTDHIDSHQLQGEMLLQKPGMNETERLEFLGELEDASKPTIGFAVLGGLFGESIDIKDNKLNGAIVVSVGLPQVNAERNLIKDHFEQIHGQGQGYDFAYKFPGISRVLQAAGRVIRSETDTGIIAFIDDRYRGGEYRKIVEDRWPGAFD